MARPDFSEFPAIAVGRAYEDFEAGQVIEHGTGRTLGMSEATMFASMTHAFNPLYVDRVHAEAAGYRDIVVAPFLVFATVLGLTVEDLSEGGGAFLGADEVTFGVAVHPGDTLRAESVVLDKRLSESRPGFGIVTWKTRGTNQDGGVVVELRRTNLKHRSAA